MSYKALQYLSALPLGPHLLLSPSLALLQLHWPSSSSSNTPGMFSPPGISICSSLCPEALPANIHRAHTLLSSRSLHRCHFLGQAFPIHSFKIAKFSTTATQCSLLSFLIIYLHSTYQNALQYTNVFCLLSISPLWNVSSFLHWRTSVCSTQKWWTVTSFPFSAVNSITRALTLTKVRVKKDPFSFFQCSFSIWGQTLPWNQAAQDTILPLLGKLKTSSSWGAVGAQSQTSFLPLLLL